MNKPQILVVEDDVEDRYFISQTFTELGFEDAVTFVEGGQMLIDYLAKGGATPKLIVMDLNMPRLNGTEVLKTLKEHDSYRDIPVVIFSTSVNELEKEACLALGAHEYVTKPIRYSDYITTCSRFYTLAQQQQKTEIKEA